MSKYRNRLQIIADILLIVNDKAKKTRIMYQANLSYRLLCRYLDEVVDAGLVSFEKEDDFYALTSKGKRFLDRHEQYSKRRKSLEQHLSHVNGEKTALEEMCLSTYTVSKDKNRLSKSREQRK